MTRGMLLAVCALLLGSASQSLAQATTVLLVRHAEKAAVQGDDPPLSPAGETRAQALRDALAAAGIQAVYTTQFQRTQQTGRPLAVQHGLTPIVIAAAGGAQQHADAVAADIRARHAGKMVLVVGHSNTVPMIVRALGGIAPPALPDNEYDNLFVVTVPQTGPATTIRARYGAPNENPATQPNRM